MKIQVMIKSVYGEELVYPADENAKRFAEMVQRKTLPPRVLKLIRELGYEIETVPAYQLEVL